MIFQTDPEFAKYPAIRHGACYFLSILHAMAGCFSLPFDHESVLEFYERELVDGDTDVDKELYVGDPQNLIDDFAGKGKALFLGVRSAYYICQSGEVEWGVWHRPMTDFNHFVHGDGKGGVLYDPWSADGSESVRSGHLISKRIARIL